MNISKFNNTLMYSNKNLEKLIRSVINESSNAVLLATFSDKCVLEDHITGSVYLSDYEFDGNILTLENFEEIELEKDTSSLEEAIGKMFDDENVDIVEAYESCSRSNEVVFEDCLSEALASKNMSDIIDYSELLGINEELEDEFRNSKMFKIYEERLEEKPVSSIKFIDWETPIKVSMIDEDEDNFIMNDFKERAEKLKTNSIFKEGLSNAAYDFIHNDNIEALENLVAENKEIVSLGKSELKEVIGLSVLTNKELLENREKITTAILNIINEDENLSYIKEATENIEKETTEKDSEAQCSEKDYDNLLNALNKASEKVEDEKLSKKIEDLISAIEDCKNTNSTDVATVKEAISLLKM